MNNFFYVDLRKRLTMANITFSHAELIKILLSNELLPKQILRPKVESDEIHFVVETRTCRFYNLFLLR